MRESDATALREVWDNDRDRLWRALLAWSADSEITSDAIAEAFAQAAPRVGTIRNLDRWIWRAAFKIAAGMLAARRETAHVGRGPELERASSSSQLPEEAAELVDALAKLSEDDRLTIVLCQIGGWSASEVGGLVGAAPGTVRVRLHRAKSKLRRIMEATDD